MREAWRSPDGTYETLVVLSILDREWAELRDLNPQVRATDPRRGRLSRPAVGVVALVEPAQALEDLRARRGSG